MSTPSHSYPTFGAVVDAFEVEVYRYLLRLTGNPAEADDLFQETFLRALKAFSRLRPRSNHRAWLYRIATNAFLNACRAARRRQEVALPAELVGGRDQDHGARLDRAAAAARCIRAITSLPPRQRAAFVQRALEGRAYAEIAAAANRRRGPTSIRRPGDSGACWVPPRAGARGRQARGRQGGRDDLSGV